MFIENSEYFGFDDLIFGESPRMTGEGALNASSRAYASARFALKISLTFRRRHWMGDGRGLRVVVGVGAGPRFRHVLDG